VRAAQPALAAPDTGLLDDLRGQQDAWRARALVRRLYRGWYRLVVERLSAVEGSTVERQRLALLVYPLSGGFTGRQLLPRAMEPLANACERLLTPLAPLLAYRCLVVLERR
jgi:hypothetical protein